MATLLDKYDWKLLAALQKNGRLTNMEVGELIGLSPSQCSRRRTHLEEAGIISGYGARLDSRALGLDVLAFVHINLRSHDPKSMRSFQYLIESDKSILEAHAVNGDADYLLKVVASNLDELSTFVTKNLLANDNLAHVKSYIVLHQMKHSSELPLPD